MKINTLNFLSLPGLMCVALFFTGDMSAQDLHLSQFQNSALNHNPAMTGIFAGDKRFSASYRRQWYSVPVEYMTFTGAFDRNFLRDGATSFWSGGLVFNYDQAGVSKLSAATLGVNASYTVGLTPGVLLTGGAMIGGAQRRFDDTDLTWGNQWDGDSFNPNLPPLENFDRMSFFYLDLGVGLNLRLQKTSRTKIDLGGGAFHLNTPNNTFYPGGQSNLPIRIAAQAYGSVEVLPRLDLMGNFLLQFQGPYQEVVLGGMLNIHVSTRAAREVQLGLGLGVRLDDALIPQIALQYDGWRAGFSYDINTSMFQVATNERGGPEFSLMYIITDVRSLDQTKVCKFF